MTTKIAYSGAHGTGKTSCVYSESFNQKSANPTKSVCAMNEVARDCPFQINLNSTYLSQLWIFTNQIVREIELANRYDIIICDRTVVDCIAYSKVFGLEDLYQHTYELCKGWICTYDCIIFNTIENNPYFFDDGTRCDCGETRKKVQEIMLSIYDELNVDLILK